MRIFAVLLLCMTLVTATAYLLKAIDHFSAISEHGWVISIIHTAFMGAFLMYACAIATVEEVTYKYTYAFNWMFFVIIALNIVSITLAMIQKFAKGHTDPKQKTDVSLENDTCLLDNLLAYKELLDAGVLTQEEFEEQKKKILEM